jgi:hypothetical protein
MIKVPTHTVFVESPGLQKAGLFTKSSHPPFSMSAHEKKEIHILSLSLSLAHTDTFDP